MDNDLRELAQALQDALKPRLERSPSLRRLARAAAAWLERECARAEGGDADSEPREAPARQADESPAGARAAQPSPAQTPRSRGVAPLKIGDAQTHIAVAGTTEEIGRARQAADMGSSDDDLAPDAATRDIDLELIERRCLLKAQSCRLFIERRRAADDPLREPAILERMNAMIAEARQMPDCFLWVFYREREQPDDDELRTIAPCYDALAATASLMQGIDALGDAAQVEHGRDAMQLLAEASSALRIALDEYTWLSKADVDQEESHLWLRHQTTIRSVFLERYMRLGDPADPAQAESVLERAQALRDRMEAEAQRRARIEALFKRIEYHADRLERSGSSAGAHDMRKMEEAIAALLETGVAPSDKRFRAALSTQAARIMSETASLDGDAAGVVAHALESADSAAKEESQWSSDADEPRQWSERVERVRALLAGRQVVIVGGEPRPEAEQRIQEAFGLSDVVWVGLTEHGSSEPMRAPIARPETALVLVLVKLVGHLHADDARAWAQEGDKPCVSLKAGYNPEQIAHAVLEQASEQLQDAAAAH